MLERDIRVNFFKVTSNFSGQRIDNFLHVYLKSIPKSMIYRIIRIGAVRVNKKRIKFQYRLQIGDELKIPFINCRKKDPSNTVFDIKKINFLKKNIIYEDDYLLALNKPAGIAVHRGSGLNFGLIEGLRILRPELQFLELVHRLDRETSGVLLIAKRRFILVNLHYQLRSQQIQKKYLALVHGKWNLSIKKISVPLLKKNIISNKKHMRFVVVDVYNGKESVTYFSIKEYFSNIATLLIVQPITGRTHQIRVHTQFVNCPIIGDHIYGDYVSNMIFQKFGLNRLFLHAFTLTFIHPYTQKVFRILAPVDQSLCSYLHYLRNIKSTLI